MKVFARCYERRLVKAKMTEKAEFTISLPFHGPAL